MKRRRRGGLALALLAGVLALTAAPRPAHAAADFLPGQRWWTVTDGGLVYHFTDDGRPYVERLLPIGRRARAVLDDWVGNEPPGDVHVVVISGNDFTNGLATPSPRNQVRLYVMQPRQPSSLMEYDDFYALLFLHELIHVYHLDWTELPATIFRKVFGRNFVHMVQVDGAYYPVYLGFPNGLLPDTLIEGLAVWGETVLTGRGRANAPASLALMRNMARDRALPRLGSAVGVRRSFPGGQAPYLFGGRFHAYADERLEVDWPRVYGRNARGWFPGLYAIPLGALELDERPAVAWNRWRRQEANLAAAFDAARPTTGAGTPLAGPFVHLRGLRLVDGALYTSVADGVVHDRIVRLGADGQAATVVERNGGSGLGVDAHGHVWYDSTRYLTDTVLVSDLWQFDGRDAHRRSAAGHVFEPDASAERLVVVRRQGERYCLEARTLAALEDPGAHGVRLTACGPWGAAMHHPRWDPAGRRVAFTMNTPEGRDDLFVWHVDAARVTRLTTAPSDERWPVWSPDGRAIFAVRTLDGTPELYRLDLDDGRWFRLTWTPTGLWQFDVGPELGRLVYTAPGAGGWTVYDAALDLRGGTPVTDVVPRAADPRIAAPSAPTPPSTATLPAARPYRAWRTLLPTGWLPRLSVGRGPDAFGAQLFMRDVLWDWFVTTGVLVDTHGTPDGHVDLSRDLGPWVLGGSAELFPVGRRDDPVPPLRLRLEAQATRVRRGPDWLVSGTAFAAVEDRVRRRLHEAARVQLGAMAAIDTRQRRRWGVEAADGVLLRALVAGDAPTGAGIPDARAEAVAASAGFLWGKAQWSVQAAAGAHLDVADGPLRYRLNPPGDPGFGTRSYSGRGVPTRGIGFADRYALWDVAVLQPAFLEWGAGSLPIYLDHIHLRPYVAGTHWNEFGGRADSVYAGVEVGLNGVVWWTTTVPLRLGVRWPVTGVDEPGPGEFYVNTGVSLAQGPRFLKTIRAARPAHPQRQHHGAW